MYDQQSYEGDVFDYVQLLANVAIIICCILWLWRQVPKQQDIYIKTAETAEVDDYIEWKSCTWYASDKHED